MSEEHKAEGRFMLGFFLGGLLGAIIMLVIGTKEGKKVRKAVEEGWKDILDDLKGKLDTLEQKGQDLVSQGEELKEVVETQLDEQKEVLTKEATKKIDTALAHIEALQEHGRQTTATLRKRLFRNTPKKS